MPYKIALHPGKLARLKFKCLIGIIGLLECNDETDNLILRIVRSIPLKVMMNNLARVFVLFEKYEKGEYE
jgi:inositol 1,4,5-triphosphate receptor type 3